MAYIQGKHGVYAGIYKLANNKNNCRIFRRDVEAGAASLVIGRSVPACGAFVSPMCCGL